MIKGVIPIGQPYFKMCVWFKKSQKISGYHKGNRVIDNGSQQAQKSEAHSFHAQ